jgi:unsaturated rhamnogalacturonyl hydrolase
MTAIQNWSARSADSIIRRQPYLSDRWRYESGVVLLGIARLHQKCREPRYWQYVKDNMDVLVAPDGSIRTYRLDEYNLDQINQGKLLFPLFHTTQDERYKRAAFLLRNQLKTHPRTSQGGFWHKQIYPHQMWLDGIYMASPFYAEFGETFSEDSAFDDVARQILLIEQHSRDLKTGLLYHGWDESRVQRWANPVTGCSPHFWGRAMGWFAMALVDVLDHFPRDHSQRPAIVAILQRLAEAVASVQDDASGLWYQILDLADKPGNYLEASASCMFVYTLARGVRQGCLAKQYLEVASRGYTGIVKRFVQVDAEGQVDLNGICSVAGLGGNPYRDGSFEYYIREPVVSNDHKGIGAFILASVEIERAI